MTKKILIGLAFSPNLKANLYEAIRTANVFDASLYAVHVGIKDATKADNLKALLANGPKLKTPLQTIWKEGNPVTVILETCVKINANLLMLGALQKENIYKYYVGSIARKLTRKAPCSVLLLIKPSVERVPCNHIVVNGLEDKKTAETMAYAFYTASNFGCKRVTIVEEISQSELEVKVNDNETLREANIKKERIEKRENLRVENILKDINTKDIIVKKQSIFGRRGYSIGHYAKVKRADLLVMNAPTKTSALDRLFPHDLEYILSELPTDVLIVK